VATAGHVLQVLRDGNERASDIATWPRCARPCAPVTRLHCRAAALGMRRVVRALPAGAAVLWLDETFNGHRRMPCRSEADLPHVRPPSWVSISWPAKPCWRAVDDHSVAGRGEPESAQPCRRQAQ